MLGDPLGLVARAPVRGRLDAQVGLGPRLLCPDSDNCGFPGPLLTGDALVHAREDFHAPGDVDAHLGFGVGVGTVSQGCWYDAVREFCVDQTSFSAIVRVPVGADIYFGRLAAGVQIVPALRMLPDPFVTFMGGLQVRYLVGPP
jgi:hypothetical protein